MTTPLVRVADMFVCAGRPVDGHGKPTGPECGKRAHPGCWGCEVQSPVLLEQHAAAIRSAAVAAGWKPGPRSEDGRYRQAMCRPCGNPTSDTARLLLSL